MDYRTVLVDPPWPQGKTGIRSSRPNQGRTLDYPTLTIDQIGAIPVAELCARDALVFLWATDRYLEEAHGVLRRWGARRHCTFVWNKNTGVCPFSVQFRNEYMLMGYFGKLSLARIGAPTYFHGKTSRHSEKPDESYALIESISFGPRIELFARRTMPGWDVWGNEVRSDIDLLVAA